MAHFTYPILKYS